MTHEITDVKAFALSAAVLYTKFLVCTMIQGRMAFAAGTRMAEDGRQQTFKCLNSESRTRKTISERHSSLWWLAPMEADADV
ncbi:hypothetical protein PF002_g33529, partial [Phytophthora fragariae]